MDVNSLVELLGRAIDIGGVIVLVGGAAVATAVAAWRAVGGGAGTPLYRAYRRWLGQAILLGLELLVAADIVRTVAVEPTLTGIAVLGGIVLVRTFLSFSIEVELYGRWPWQRQAEPGSGSLDRSPGRGE